MTLRPQRQRRMDGRMGSRIEVVEVLSFRLEVPRLALERLPQELKAELPLKLERKEGRWVLEHVGYPSYLRFEPGVDSAELTDVLISDDAEGLFFHAVLGALMLRFGGDLDARLVFDPTDASTEESWTEVRVRRGRTPYPGLATRGAAARLAQSAHEGGAVGAAPEGDRAPEEEGAEEPLTAEEEELSRILNQADAAWREYQRLKAKREG